MFSPQTSKKTKNKQKLFGVGKRSSGSAIRMYFYTNAVVTGSQSCIFVFSNCVFLIKHSEKMKFTLSVFLSARPGYVSRAFCLGDGPVFSMLHATGRVHHVQQWVKAISLPRAGFIAETSYTWWIKTAITSSSFACDCSNIIHLCNPVFLVCLFFSLAASESTVIACARRWIICHIEFSWCMDLLSLSSSYSLYHARMKIRPRSQLCFFFLSDVNTELMRTNKRLCRMYTVWYRAVNMAQSQAGGQCSVEVLVRNIK